MLSNIYQVVRPIMQILADNKRPFPRRRQFMHLGLILNESKHQISLLKGSGPDPATVVATKILLVNRRASSCYVSLFIEPVQSVLSRTLIIRFNIRRNPG